MNDLSVNNRFPIKNVTRTVFLNNIISNSNINIGDYTYYDDPDNACDFENNILYLFPTCTNKLIIGKFCQIATGVRFLMNGANHNMQGYSTYPFNVMAPHWNTEKLCIKSKGDIIIGNDVWLGNSATIMPGVTIGDGAIIGTNALVTKNVPPYAIVGGNPATIIRMRFNDNSIQCLLNLQWWHWPIDKIKKNINTIIEGI